MNREDGGELGSEHPVTAMDMIDVTPRGELDLPENVIRCSLGEPLCRDTTWMDEDPSSDDFDDWGA